MKVSSPAQSARDALPHQPLVLLCLAEQARHGDPTWLAQYVVSRLLAEPHDPVLEPRAWEVLPFAP